MAPVTKRKLTLVGTALALCGQSVGWPWSSLVWVECYPSGDVSFTFHP